MQTKQMYYALTAIANLPDFISEQFNVAGEDINNVYTLDNVPMQVEQEFAAEELTATNATCFGHCGESKDEDDYNNITFYKLHSVSVFKCSNGTLWVDQVSYQSFF